MSNASSLFTSPTAVSNKNLKRERETAAPDVVPDDGLYTATSPSSTGAAAATTSNFRNVSACNRCRNRKNRCDQKLPRCTNCERANVKCVGFDPVSKREIPRSYVYYLETRVHSLEALLTAHGVPLPPPSDDFPIGDAIKPGVNVPFPIQDEDPTSNPNRPTSRSNKSREQRQHPPSSPPPATAALDPALKQHDDGERLDKLTSTIGMVSVRGSNTPSRSQSASSGPSASASGISFARVMFAAVKRSVNGNSSGSHTSSPSDRHGSSRNPSSKHRTSSSTSSHDASGGATGSGAGNNSPLTRDSFFGLSTRPGIKPAPFPDKALGARLTELYFDYANPQIPVLHRGEFGALFDRVYAADPRTRGPRELYLLNIVFAIGSGIIMDSPDVERSVAEPTTTMTTGGVAGVDGSGGGEQDDGEAPGRKRLRLASRQHQPEEYHASAIVHLENFLGAAPVMQGVGGGLEELQAVLLLAGLALLRPVAPGLWYIIGVAMRLSIDLGLHFEDIDHDLDNRATYPDNGGSAGVGRKQWTRDLRRRLWWCVFNLDRLVSSCVGRPVSISETVVTTEFPSLLDDEYITPSGFMLPPSSTKMPSYKLVSRHYLRLRLLQSEMLQVLQHRQGDQARQLGANQSNPYIVPDLNSPFLQRFGSFREWRADIDRRLWKWKEEAPRQFETGVAFTPLYYDLNFWQAIIMLYRQSLAVPEPLASELSPATGEDVQSPGAINLELEEDKQMVFLKVAQAGHTVLKIYRQLHRLKLVNYTFLATHHLFMSGISFLYAIWGSTVVRSQLSLDDVDFTILAATSVLSDLIVKCPPAEACRDAFVRMSKATVSMVMSTTGFGNASTLGSQKLKDNDFSSGDQPSSTNTVPSPTNRRPRPKFDMNLQSLFSEEELPNASSLAWPASSKPSTIRMPQQHSTRTNAPASPFSDTGDSVTNPHLESFSEVPKSHSTPGVTPGDWTQYANLDLDFLDDFAFGPELAAAGHGGSGHANILPWNSATTTNNNSNHSNVSVDSNLAPNSGFTSLPAVSSNMTNLDLSGTTGFFDSSGAWEANGELFDTFFFGPAGGGANVNGF